MRVIAASLCVASTVVGLFAGKTGSRAYRNPVPKSEGANGELGHFRSSEQHVDATELPIGNENVPKIITNDTVKFFS